MPAKEETSVEGETVKIVLAMIPLGGKVCPYNQLEVIS